jgi:hypothetical protein
MNLKQLIASTDNKDRVHLILEEMDTKRILDIKVTRKYLNRNKRYFNNCNLNVILCKKI